MYPIALHDLQSGLAVNIGRHHHRRSIDDRINFATERQSTQKRAPDITVRKCTNQRKTILHDENNLKRRGIQTGYRLPQRSPWMKDSLSPDRFRN